MYRTRSQQTYSPSLLPRYAVKHYSQKKKDERDYKLYSFDTSVPGTRHTTEGLSADHRQVAIVGLTVTKKVITSKGCYQARGKEGTSDIAEQSRLAQIPRGMLRQSLLTRMVLATQ